MKRLKRISSAEGITMQDKLEDQIAELDSDFDYIIDGLEKLTRSDSEDIRLGMDIADELAIALKNTIAEIAEIFSTGIIEESVNIEADTVKKANGKWVNRGDDGEEHGEFSTKKEADAQRKAMYAKGFRG